MIPSLDERAVPVVPDCEALVDGWKANSDRLFPKWNEPKYAQADPVRPFVPILWKDGRVYWFEVNQRTCHVLQQAWLPHFGCGDLVATGQLSSETDKHEQTGMRRLSISNAAGMMPCPLRWKVHRLTRKRQSRSMKNGGVSVKSPNADFHSVSLSSVDRNNPASHAS